ncbi:MAG: single-stranded DNA-binding protein [Bacteroidales bacterium]|nr:single-stranded DNA-binding protein [Bacteroidales bacterium]
MEQLNRIELRGNVGNIKLQTVGDKLAARFTVATNYAYKDKDGSAVIETTWHNVNAWQGRGIANLHDIKKGSKVYVSGRLRSQKFQGEDQTERNFYEIIPKTVTLIEDDEKLQCEF